MTILDEALQRLGFTQLQGGRKKGLQYKLGDYTVKVYPTMILRMPMLTLMIHRYIAPELSRTLIRGSNRPRTEIWYGRDIDDLFNDISISYSAVMLEEARRWKPNIYRRRF